jgi:hypothetical protein
VKVQASQKGYSPKKGQPEPWLALAPFHCRAQLVMRQGLLVVTVTHQPVWSPCAMLVGLWSLSM